MPGSGCMTMSYRLCKKKNDWIQGWTSIINQVVCGIFTHGGISWWSFSLSFMAHVYIGMHVIRVSSRLCDLFRRLNDHARTQFCVTSSLPSLSQLYSLWHPPHFELAFANIFLLFSRRSEHGLLLLYEFVFISRVFYNCEMWVYILKFLLHGDKRKLCSVCTARRKESLSLRIWNHSVPCKCCFQCTWTKRALVFSITSKIKIYFFASEITKQHDTTLILYRLYEVCLFFTLINNIHQSEQQFRRPKPQFQRWKRRGGNVAWQHACVVHRGHGGHGTATKNLSHHAKTAHNKHNWTSM